MRRVTFVVVMLLVLTCVSAAAADFEVNIFPSEARIKLNETATFDLEVTNPFPTQQVFEVYSSDVTWDVRTEQVLRVEGGQKLKTHLFVTPLNLNPGAYNLPLSFKRS